MTRAAALQRLKAPVAAALVVAATWPVWRAFAFQRPLVSWYFPRLAVTWGLTLLFSGACLAIGTRVVSWLTGPVRRDGFWALSFATGVLAFGVAMGVLGHLGLLSPGLLGLLPLLLLAAGWSSLVDGFLDARARWAKVPSLSVWEVLFGIAGVLGVTLAVLPVLAPENINYDARWYHLVIADRYALMGRIAASPEGNHLLAGPHLASLLYTWAFLQDGASTFDKALLANHVEAACFIGTLALVPPLARALAPRGSTVSYRLAWVAMLTFPALYIYDTGLMGGADHVAALWAPAALLTLLQARERGDRRSWVLFGLSLGALALTKYTAILLLAPLVVWVAVGSLTWPLRASTLRPRLVGPLVGAGAALAVTSLHWLRNWVFYGNPVYPLAARLFTTTTPWTRDSAAWNFWYSRELFVPTEARLPSRIAEVSDAVFDYHLNLYTWRDFTNGLPVFGSLFAISLVLLPFLRGAKRLWALVLAIHAGIAIWFVLAHQMRYLLILVPLMAAACAVLAVEAWSWRSWLVRAAIVGAVAVQLIGAGDAPFAPTHRTNGRQSPLGKAVSFLGRGIAEDNDARFKLWKELEEVGALVPRNARLLIHGSHATLGMNRVVLTDAIGIQYGLNYAELGSLSAIHRKLMALGVTHVASVDSVSDSNSSAGELLFRTYLHTVSVEQKSAHGWLVGEVPHDEPVDLPGLVVYSGCGSTYASGLYELQQLSAPPVPASVDPVWVAPKETQDLVALAARATYAVVEDGCPAPFPLGPFRVIGRQETKGLTRAYYVRRP